MKFLVDELPSTCEGCQYCAEGMMMTPLGVPKPVDVCVLQQLVPPKNPNEIPPTIDKDKSPIENDCPCHSDKIGVKEKKNEVEIINGMTKSGIII